MIDLLSALTIPTVIGVVFTVLAWKHTKSVANEHKLLMLQNRTIKETQWKIDQLALKYDAVMLDFDFLKDSHRKLVNRTNRETEKSHEPRDLGALLRAENFVTSPPTPQPPELYKPGNVVSQDEYPFEPPEPPLPHDPDAINHASTKPS